MARSLCNASFTAALADGITIFANRRGYAAAAAAVTVARKTVADQKAVKGLAEAKTSWVPDPVTGYYRPANRSVEIDAVELRKLLLSHKSQNRGRC